MPRPKRLKTAPSAPARLTRTSASMVVEVPKPPVESRTQYSDMTGVTSADEEIVAPVIKRGRGRPPKNKPGPVDHASEPPDILSGSEHDSPEVPLEDYLMGNIDLESSSPSVEIGRRDQSSTAVESSFHSVTNFRRRPRQPSILGRRPPRPRSSSVEESNRVDSNGQTNMSSRNASTLSLGNFRRRPRQPSILGRARSSSIGFDTDRGTPAQPASTLRLGNFRRRAQESSVLGTSRKPQQDRPADDMEDEDDFNPEDESTPLQLSKAAPTNNSPIASSFNPRKRKLSAKGEPQPSSAVPSSEAAHDQDDSHAAPLSDEAADKDDFPSSPPEAPIASIEAVSNGPIDGTMALPQSSSSPPESPLGSPSPPRMMQRFQSIEYHSRGRRPVKARTSPPPTRESPVSSPPPLTHSPNRPARGAAGVMPATKSRGRGQTVPPSTFSTAQLQNLLPRRRRPVNPDPYEIDSSDGGNMPGLASDDDELISTNVAPQSRRPNPSTRRPAPIRRPGRPKNLSKPRPETATGKANYGSRPNATSNKENEEYDPDHSLAPLPDEENRDANQENGQGVDRLKELEEAAKKFKEVDKWELEFEDVTAGSSSPLGAR